MEDSHKIPQPVAGFVFLNPNVETHLVTSVASSVYLALGMYLFFGVQVFA